MIWKFPLSVIDKTVVAMPHSAQVLCVQVQNGMPYLWVIVRDTDAYKTTRTYSTYGTGQGHNEITGRYIGTYQLHDGAWVFHVFEEPTQ